jgi:hypothetical protein
MNGKEQKYLLLFVCYVCDKFFSSCGGADDNDSSSAIASV